MLWNGVWGINGYIKDPTVSKFLGIAGLPKGAQSGNSICWAGFAVYSKSANKDAAWAFLKWVGADKGAQAFANYALTDVQSIAQAQGKTTDPYWAPVMTDLANVHPLPDFTTTKFSDCVNTPFGAALGDYFNKGGDLQTIMDKTAATADACLAK
jgi:multiple sugar transport system substrate-binding protein